MDRTPRKRLTTIATVSAVFGLLCGPAMGAAANAEDTAKPDLIGPLAGYEALWHSDGKNDLHGDVRSGRPLQRNDQLTSWINGSATSAQQFRALQDAQYTEDDGSGYDQSMTIADGLGKNLGRLYAQGRMDGKLPLTTALINSEDGSTGAFVKTSDAKKHFSYPRPFLSGDPKATAPAGDAPECAPSKVNASSLVNNRKGFWWADASGTLKIKRVAPRTDTTHAFAHTDVKLDGEYGDKGLCTGGSFPSGHTTTAYQAGITLATLVPELAPNVLARTSEAGNNRIVLGVHYPLDIIGGRMSGESALAARWSDPKFRHDVIEPAQAELRNYLTKSCTSSMHVNSLAACIANDTPYRDNPYGGYSMPGGSSQIVSGPKSAVRVYTERMSYGFAATSSTHVAPVVPQGAANLLLTAFPSLSEAQRSEVLAQTESASGHPLAVGAGAGWERLNLAAAMSATVRVNADGSVRVVSTGGSPKVLHAHGVSEGGDAPQPADGPKVQTDYVATTQSREGGK